MARIKHIALRTPDPEKTAQFYKEVFGLKEVGRAGAGLYLSDGYINMAVLKATEGMDKAGQYGIDHFGFQVDDLEEMGKKLEEHGSEALVAHNPPAAQDADGRSYYEMKYLGPDRQVIDISASGWVGTEG